jgi:signal transduction histidine kinase
VRHLRGVRFRLMLMVTVVVVAALLAVVWSSRRVTRSEFREFVARLETEVGGADVGSTEAALTSGLQSLGDGLQQSLHRDGDWSAADDLFAAAAPGMLRNRAALVVVGGDTVAAASDEGLVDAEVAVRDDGELEISGWHVLGSPEAFEDQAVRFRGPHRILRTSDGDPVGVLYIVPLPDPGTYHFADAVHEQDFFDSLDRWMILVVVGVGALALIAAVLVSGRILGPVAKLTDAARRMGGGELGLRVDVPSDDELGELADAFNAMAASIERNEKLRRDMVSDVAHELRTPLTNLRAQLEAVQDGLVAPSAKLIASLHEDAMLLGRLIDDLQELALADAGQLRLEPEEVDVVVELERVAASFATPETRGGPEIDIEVAAGRAHGLPPVRADRQRLRQILSNLIDNGIRHGGGHIVIRARAQADAPAATLSTPPPARFGFVCITLADRGSGIAAADPADVFERFYRTDPSRQRATGGAGLGLAIVRQLVEAQGGGVWVDSAPGAGATFGFCLPVAESTPPADAVATPRTDGAE